jgi:hypothetical protein
MTEFSEYVEEQKKVQVKAHQRRHPRPRPNLKPRGKAPMKGLKLTWRKKVLSLAGLGTVVAAILEPRFTIIGVAWLVIAGMVTYCYYSCAGRDEL